ncbi:hypothetical protein V6Z11_D04G177700 [Gossypium hirsutum]
MSWDLKDVNFKVISSSKNYTDSKINWGSKRWRFLFIHGSLL